MAIAHIQFFVLVCISAQVFGQLVSDYKGFTYDNEAVVKSKPKLNLCQLHKAVDFVPINLQGLRSDGDGVLPYYLTMSKRKARHHYYNLITGEVRPYSSPTDLDFCLQIYLFWDDPTVDVPATFVAYNKFAAEVKCSPSGEPTSGYLNCVGESGVGFKTFVTNTDNSTYLVTVHCWEDGVTTWGVYSKEPELDPFKKWEILYHVRSIGFQPSDRRETDYVTHCHSTGRTFADLVNQVTYITRQKKERQKQQQGDAANITK